ncbi:MAG: hypothetical protein JXJ19_08265 [Elusimicrobia bacterium]|nr:hypothetical protein [Elusimicrobiota bacterium]
MPTSDDFRIIAVGTDEFRLPYSAAGFETIAAGSQGDALKEINAAGFDKVLFLIEEDIIDDIARINEMEKNGLNALVIKAWGRSRMAEDRIRQASIKATGTDIIKDKM